MNVILHQSPLAFLNIKGKILAITLCNDNLELVIETAGETYKGSRFDWNGLISQIYFKGVPLLGQEKKLFKRNPKIYGRGLHNEFGIRDCVGYDEVPAGGLFPKIGTGWLKSDENPYFFYTQYPLEKVTFDIQKKDATTIECKCTSGCKNGYDYHYTKKIVLDDNGFTIFYKLENKGEKTISTTEYVHNFLLPGNSSVGAHLKLTFNWDFDSEKLGTFNNSKGCVLQKENAVTFTATPKEEFFLGGVWAAKKENTPQENGKWTLEDSKNNICISETTSFVPDSSDVWGHNKAISPELFFRFSIASGEVVEWNRRFDIHEL